MDGDGHRIPPCEACPFIGRICPPDCPLAPHFNSGRTRAVLKDSKGRSVTECARSYHPQELRRIFVEGAVEFFAGASAGREGRRLLVEAVLSEAEKGLDPPPKPALHFYPFFSLTKAFARMAWKVDACHPVPGDQDSSFDEDSELTPDKD